MARTYYRTRRDDPLLAKFRFAAVSGDIIYIERFTAWRFSDFVRHSAGWNRPARPSHSSSSGYLSLPFFSTPPSTPPTLIFFVRRAYCIWDRNELVARAGYGLVLISFIANVVVCGFELQTPLGGFKPIPNEEFAATIPAFQCRLQLFSHIKLAGDAIQLLTTGSLCFLTCYGIYRHRNGYSTFDTAVSKIAFVSGESLLPMLVLNIANIAVFTAGRYDSRYNMILRPLVSMSPAIYAHALLTALTSRERVREILQASPVRELARLSISDPAVGGDLEADHKGRIGEKDSREQASFPVPVLLDTDSAPEQKRRQRPAALHITNHIDSQTSMIGTGSRSTAPISPSGGTTSWTSGPLVRDASIDNLPSGPVFASLWPSLRPLDPLIKNGTIIRPPISSTDSPQAPHSSGRPDRSPTLARTSDLFDGWRREQAAVRRTVSAATAAEKGDRAWWSSLGHVPPPRPAIDAEETRLDGNDDGMDMFDVLNFGPPPDAKK